MGQYNEPINESDDLHLQLKVQVLAYNLAEKYDVPTLICVSEKKLKITLREEPTTEVFLSVVGDVYTIPTPTNALRSIAVSYAKKKFRDMMQSPDQDMLRTTLQDTPDFAFDVLQQLATGLTGRCHGAQIRLPKHPRRAVSNVVREGSRCRHKHTMMRCLLPD